MRKILLFALLLLTPVLGHAQADLGTLRAKFVKIMAIPTGGKVACKDADMSQALAAQGVSLDPNAQVAWATTPAEVKAYAADKRIVLVPKVELLSNGASLALIEEGGKMVFYLHYQNLQATGKTLADTVLRVAKRYQ